MACWKMPLRDAYILSQPGPTSFTQNELSTEGPEAKLEFCIAFCVMILSLARLVWTLQQGKDICMTTRCREVVPPPGKRE